MKIVFNIVIIILITSSSANSQTKISNEDDIIELLNGDWEVKIPVIYFWIKYNPDYHLYKLILNDDSTGTFTRGFINIAPFVKIKKENSNYYMCHYENKELDGREVCNRIRMIDKKRLIVEYSNRKYKYKRIKNSS